MATGVSMFGLTHFGIRNNFKWALNIYFLIVIIAEGINAFGMWKANSFYGFPLTVILIAITGNLLFRFTKSSPKP